MSSYTSWYKDGTASATNGSTAVTGVNTYWSTAGIHPGDLLTFDDGNTFAEIASVNSDTSITLAKAFTQGTKANASYAIIRNFTAGTLPEVASQVIDALRKYTKYFNEDIATLTGKSAYEVAVENGYTGTVAQWLESLKAAQEWSTLNDRTELLTYHSAGAHNAFYRGKNLGTTITAAQLAAIKNDTFSDIYPGDFWKLPIDGTTVATVIGCNINDNNHMPNHIGLLLTNSTWNFPINDTATCEGHFLNSKMYTEHLPYILSKVKEVIPEENILSWSEQIGDSIDSSGNVNHRTATSVQIGIPSFTNVMGYENGNNYAYDTMGRNSNWPLFRLNGRNRRTFIYKWLGQSASAANWCVMKWDASQPQALHADAITVGGSNIYTYSYILLG